MENGDKQIVKNIKSVSSTSFADATWDEIKPERDERVQKITRKIFDNLKANEINQILKLRNFIATFLITLLFVQNIATYTIVIITIFTNQLKDLQLIFSTLIGATLTETFGGIYIIVKWLYREIRYPSQQQNTLPEKS